MAMEAKFPSSSDYAAKVFGFATFGRVYGAIICLSGLVNLSQYGLDALTHRPFRGNPIPINAAMAGAGLVLGSVLVTFVQIKGKEIRQKQLEETVDESRQRLIPRIPEEDEEGV